MPSGIPATSELGDDALHQVALRLDDYERLLSLDVLQDPVGRHAWGQSERSRHGNALVDMVAVAENFASVRLLQSRPALTDQDVFSWKAREKSWHVECGVTLSGLGRIWTDLMGLVEVRNALQHGLGRLTDSQLSARRREGVLSAMASTGVRLHGNVIVLRSPDVIKCARVCSEFIAQLDSLAPRN